jgi:Uncharacterized conserved protein
VKHLPTVRLVVEIRNRAWLDKRITDLLREYNVALALTDLSNMRRPWEVKNGLDLVTTDFVYVRWLGDRKGIEALTMRWDKTVIDRTGDLRNWAALFRKFISRNLKVYAYANNHYAGHGPGRSSCFGTRLAVSGEPEGHTGLGGNSSFGGLYGSVGGGGCLIRSRNHNSE